MKITKQRFAALISISFLFACGPNADNEAQYWKNNQKNIVEFSQKWPGFKPHLDAVLSVAKPEWEVAIKVSDKDKKAKKMKEVNAKFEPLLGKLQEIQAKSDSLKNKIADLNKLKLSGSKHSSRNSAVNAAYEKLGQVETALAMASPGTPDAAVETCKEQISVLIDAQGDLDRAYASAKPAKEKKKKKSKR